MTCPFKVGDRVELTREARLFHKDYVRRSLLARSKLATQGSVKTIWRAFEVTWISIRSSSKEATWRESDLKKQRSWMGEFTVKSEPLDELAHSQAQARITISNRFAQRKNLGVIR
jgi:hypothetical protein